MHTLITALILALLQTSAGIINQNPHQGLWVRASSMVHPDSIDRIIDIAVDAGITDIYAQVVIGGYAYCNIKNIPRSQYLAKVSGSKYDPLKDLIKTAHKNDIKVHAWINTLLVWSLREEPDSNRHLYYTHPEWFVKDVTGRSMHNYSYEKWVECGLEGLYLDPSREEVRNFITSTCSEIINKYDIEGVHLDFIRYPGTLWGLPMNDTSALFSGTEGNNLISLSFTGYSRQSFLQRWLAWHYWRQSGQKEQAITNIMMVLRNRLDALKRSKLKLSAATFPNPALGRYRFAQYWESWQGIIDYPIAMAYTINTPFFVTLHDYCVNKFPEAVIGIGLIWPEMAIEGHIQYFIARDAGTGTCIFDFTALDTMPDSDKLFNRDSLARYDPLMTNPNKIPDAFTQRPPSGLLTDRTNGDCAGEADDYMAYLSSLSVDQIKDLERLGIDYTEYRVNLLNDIIAFRNLDARVFPINEPVNIPPRRQVSYSFTPWNKDDTLQTIAQALGIEEFSLQDRFYPEALNDLCRAVFEADLNVIDTCITRAGIYTFSVTDIINDNAKITRDSMPADQLALFLSWHIIKKAKAIINQ